MSRHCYKGINFSLTWLLGRIPKENATKDKLMKIVSYLDKEIFYEIHGEVYANLRDIYFFNIIDNFYGN